MRLLAEIFGAYIVTATLVNGTIFYVAREWIKPHTPMLFKGNPRKHLVDCRMCMTPWVSLAISLALGSWTFYGWYPCVVIDLVSFSLMWGAGYFLCTQER